MNNENYDTELKISSNGPVMNTIGAILSVVGAIISFFILVIFTIATVSDYKIMKNYIETTATVIEDNGAGSYKVKYYIDNKEYVNTLFDTEEYKVGDIVNICYKPSDYNYITYKPQDITFDTLIPNIFALLFLIVCIAAAKRNINNIKYYMDPENNTLDDRGNTTSIGIDNVNITLGNDGPNKDEPSDF